MHLESLNYLRAISILLIMVSHFCIAYGQGMISRYFGYVFVDIFFILSALLMGLKYGTKSLSIVDFMKKRLLRLASVYYPYLIISFMALALINGGY